MPSKTLSIVVPVYNEEKTLARIVERVIRTKLLNIKKEIIIINDGSRDNSGKVALSLAKKYKFIKYYGQPRNMGKGAAIRAGFKHVSGDFVVIHDADLEYNPQDFSRLLKPLLENRADVVYGSRMMGNIKWFIILSHYYGNKFLSFLTFLLYGRRITDMETCYKMMKRKVVNSLVLHSNKFDIEPEITSKILKKKFRFIEIPIDYNARSF